MRGLSSTWSVGAVCIASLLAVPSLTVLGSLSQPASDVWVYLWRTQLRRDPCSQRYSRAQ